MDNPYDEEVNTEIALQTNLELQAELREQEGRLRTKLNHYSLKRGAK